MSTGTLIYIITMGFTVCIFGGITYLFKKTGDFSLLNGFANRPDEEKEYLQKNGYLKAIASIFQYSFWLLLLTFIGGFLPIPYVFEIGISIFILYLLIGLVWVQRFDVPKKRKKMFWIMGSLSAATIIFIGGITIAGYLDNEVTITEDTLAISGMYGEEWSRNEISEVMMMDELPDVIVKTNGFAMSGMLKGRFNLEAPYGGSTLFIQNKAGPFLYIHVGDEHLFIGKKDANDMNAIYEALIEN